MKQNCGTCKHWGSPNASNWAQCEQPENVALYPDARRQHANQGAACTRWEHILANAEPTIRQRPTARQMTLSIDETPDQRLLELGFPEMLRRVQEAEQAVIDMAERHDKEMADRIVQTTRHLTLEVERARGDLEEQLSINKRLTKKLDSNFAPDVADIKSIYEDALRELAFLCSVHGVDTEEVSFIIQNADDRFFELSDNTNRRKAARRAVTHHTSWGECVEGEP